MSRIGRNDPCPCGSGKKYKQCCMREDEAAARRRRLELGAADRALEWLAKHHEAAASEALEKVYLGKLGEGGVDKLRELPEDILDLVDLNAHEWLLVDGAIRVDGEPLRVVRGEVREMVGERAGDRTPVALHEAVRAERAHLRVEHLRLDAVAIHGREARDRIEGLDRPDATAG